MLNLNCVICAEVFIPSSDAYVTTCGHMFHHVCLLQWMERSKTCPQCRGKCTKRDIFKLYFNLSNLDANKLDIFSVQEQLENALLKLNEKENEFEKSQEKIQNLKETQKKCMKTISGLEEKLKKYEFIVQTCREELKVCKQQTKNVNAMQNEIRELKNKIETMEDLSAILASSKQDADKLLQNQKNPEILSTWVSALKRELRICESKINDIRVALKVVKNDLRKENELKKKNEERISQLESDNYQLNEKIKSFETEINRSKVASEVKQNSNLDSASSQLKENPDSHCNALVLQYTQMTSPSIIKNVKKIEESNSPYLNIKSSSIGLVPLFKRNHEDNIKRQPNRSDEQNNHVKYNSSVKYTIFKKPRLGNGMTHLRPTTNNNPNYVFNGFGGSEKRSNFLDEPQSEDETEPKPTANKILSSSLNNYFNSVKRKKIVS